MKIFGKDTKELKKEDVLKLYEDFYKFKEDRIISMIREIISWIRDDWELSDYDLLLWRRFLYKHIKFDTPLDVYINIDPETGEKTEIHDVDLKYIENVLIWGFKSCYSPNNFDNYCEDFSEHIHNVVTTYVIIEEPTLYDYFVKEYEAIINLN